MSLPARAPAAPVGVDASAFSAPAWQRLIQAEEGSHFQHRMPTVRAGVLTTAFRRGLEHIRFRGGNKGRESSPEFETSWGATAASARGGELTLGFQDLFSLVGGLIGSKAR